MKDHSSQTELKAMGTRQRPFELEWMYGSAREQRLL